MTAPIADASLYTDTSGLTALRRDAQANDPKAVREAAKQFESLFTRMMLKSMREASFDDPIFGSDQEKFYQGMFDDQLAVTLSNGKGLGLADMLVQQLTRAGLIPADSTAPSTAAGAASTRAPLTPAAQTDFITEVWPAAQAAGRELGVDPTHLVAQAALESGWGQSIPTDANGNSSFNLFGMKTGTSWSGPAVAVRTLEFEGGVPVPRTDKFRAYTSPAESFRDYVDLLRNNPRYADALNTGSNTEAFATALQKGGYATDPTYARKIQAIAQNVAALRPALKSADARPIDSTSTML